jgi:hypothetical protein
VNTHPFTHENRDKEVKTTGEILKKRPLSPTNNTLKTKTKPYSKNPQRIQETK